MKNKIQYKIQFLLGILLLALLCSIGEEQMLIQGRIHNLKVNANESAAFRKQDISANALSWMQKISTETSISMCDLLAVWMTEYNFRLTDDLDLSEENYRIWKARLNDHRDVLYRELSSSYAAIWDDVQYFPTDPNVTYENTWMFERSYGGNRGHEGVDLMPPENIRGYYPIFSMTDGTVEKIGWLEKGGYRIGIRSPSGGYFYYAHLSSYAEELKEGDTVSAGTLLGYMGDTGYSKVPGTTGNFDVHLHLGIYIKTEQQEEVSVNPYPVLLYLKEQTLKYKGHL